MLNLTGEMQKMVSITDRVLITYQLPISFLLNVFHLSSG
jgi:hypothetical protein